MLKIMAQTDGGTTLKLGAMLKEESAIRDFIKKHLEPTTISQLDMLRLDHLMSGHNLNLTLKDSTESFTVEGFKVSAIYGYSKDENQNCLYVVLPYSPDFVSFLRDLLGQESGDLSDEGSPPFLIWDRQSTEIILKRNNFAHDKKQMTLYIMQNVSMDDLMSTEKIF